MDIYSLIFYEILKFDPSSTFLTGDLIHDLIFGVLIPTIGLIIILRVFSDYIIGGHKDLKILATIGGLAFIIFGGWFPIIAQFYLLIFGVGLFLTVINVFTRHIINEEGQKALKEFSIDFISKKIEKLILKMKPEESELFIRYYTVCLELRKKQKMLERYQKELDKAVGDKAGEVQKYFLGLIEANEQEILKLENEKMLLEKEMRKIFGKRKANKLIRKVNEEINKLDNKKNLSNIIDLVWSKN